MKSIAKKLFLIACTFALIILCSNLKSQRILVEGAVSNGWQYSIMQVAGGTSYAYDVKPTTILSGSVAIPDYLGGCPVKALADGAFKNHTELTRIQIPCTVTTIPKETFYGCSKLAGLTFSNNQCNISTIDSYAFYECKSLKSIALSKVSSIGSYAFTNCASIQELTFSENLTSIGTPNAFGNCKALTSIKFFSSELEIGSYCFTNCSSLKTVSFPSDMKRLKVFSSGFDGCSSISTLTIPCDVNLGEQAFYNCYGLTQVTFGGKATFFDKNVFACSNNTSASAQSQLTVLFKEDAFLSTNAFNGNKQLSELTFEKNANFSDFTPLNGTTNLKKVTVLGDFTDNTSMSIGENGVETLVLGGNVISTHDTSHSFPNLSKVVYKGNKVDSLLSGYTMIFEDTVTSVSGTIDSSVAEEVVFYNPSTKLDNITSSVGQKKTKFYGLKGSTADIYAASHKDNTDFCDLIVSDWNFRVNAEHYIFQWKAGEAMPNLTPETLGLTAQATYYREDAARTIPYSPEDSLKGYQLEIPDLKEGENTISVKYSGWNKPLTIIIQKQEVVIPATATPSSTPTVPVEQTESPSPTDSVNQTENPSPTDSVNQTESPTPTDSVEQTESPTPTAQENQTESPSPTAPAEQTESPIPTTPVKKTENPSPTALATQKPSLASTVLEKQTASPTLTAPVVSASPVVTATPKVLQKNKTYLVKNIKYKVLSFKGKTGTASIVGYNKAASSLQLTNTVKICNHTLKVTKIDAKAFRDCQKLSGKLVIPKYVTSIGDSAFYNCKELTSVTLTKRLTSIGTSAFENCKNLQSVMFKGKNIKKIGKKAFFHNSKMPVRKFNMARKYIPYYHKILIKQKQYN